MILADTDVLIDYLVGSPTHADKVADLIAANDLLTTAITCFELLSGAPEGKRGDAVRRLVAAIPILSLDREAATQAAAVRQDLVAIGFSIGMADSLIAGIAITNNFPLLTRNRRHFEKIRDLQLLAGE